MLVKNQTDPSGFFFAKQETPQIITRLGNDVVHRRSVRGLSTLKALQHGVPIGAGGFAEARQKLSANAVVNIISYYKKVEMPSATEFECHAGSGAHVFLKGDLAKIAGE